MYLIYMDGFIQVLAALGWVREGGAAKAYNVDVFLF